MVNKIPKKNNIPVKQFFEAWAKGGKEAIKILLEQQTKKAN